MAAINGQDIKCLRTAEACRSVDMWEHKTNWWTATYLRGEVTCPCIYSSSSWFGVVCYW